MISICRFSILYVLSILVSFSYVSGQEEEVLTILHESGTQQNYRTWFSWSGAPLKLVHHLNDLSIQCIESREAEIRQLKSASDWRKRQVKIHRYFNTHVGPWPERTPLNAQITGILHKDGYRVEKIIFESLPGFYVTGALFIPEDHQGKGPAILKVIGHSAQAFRRDIYQNVILNLVHKGCIVFAIDPIGQGERVQYFNEDTGNSDVGGSTTEHSHAGVQCFLAGKSIARYFTWDGMRAIDYLCSRPEVDPDRIGITGLSGGGTQSSYIAAMDDRVLAAAPTGYIVGYRRLLESIGPQDAEQIFYHGLNQGIDHADLLEVRAPKPTLHVTTTRDFFSIQGARETEQEVQKCFRILGSPENYKRVEDDYEHGFTRKNNEATYAFFQQALHLPGDHTEDTYPYLTEAELTVTKTGQISTSRESETVFSINRKETLPLLEALGVRRNNISSHIPDVIREARRLSGFQEKSALNGAPVFRGQYQRDGYRVEKWGLQGEGDYILPVLVFVPDGNNKFPAIIYAHDEGKIKESQTGGELEALVKLGYVVAAVDLLGFGETAFYRIHGHASVQPFYNAQLSGRSVTGINAGDALQVFHFLKQRTDVSKNSIGAIAIGATGPALLHAAAFEKDLAWLAMNQTITNYASIVLNKYYQVNGNSLVAGALTAYDLPDLMASLAPRKCLIINPRNHQNEPESMSEIDQAVKYIKGVYTSHGTPDQIEIIQTSTTVRDIIGEIQNHR